MTDPAVRDLIARFLEDRDGLDDVEFGRLVEALQNSPTLAQELRVQLTLDDLLAQKLAVDRRDFLSQVSQRVNDYERQVADTFDQVTELRAMAEAERKQPGTHEPTTRGTWWLSLASAAAIFLAVGLVAGTFSFGGRPVVATVEEVHGTVEIDRGQGLVAANIGDTIRVGDEVRTVEGEVAWRYNDDRTLVRLEAHSNGRVSEHSGKQVRIDRGALFADIAKQAPGRPMTFLTPHAIATVRGTQLRLVIREDNSELEVTHGAVDFARNDQETPVRVSTNEACVASERSLDKHSAEWPSRRDEISLQLPHENSSMVVRNPDDRGKLLDTPLLKDGAADFLYDEALRVAGGAFHSEDAAQDLVKLFRDHDQVTWEVAFVPEEGDLGPKATLFDFRTPNQRPNVTLAKEGGEWRLRLSTDQGPHQPAELRFPAEVQPKRLSHLAMTYRPGEWKAYVDGKLVAERNDVHGNLNGWQPGQFYLGSDVAKQAPWKGAIFTAAVYRRVLDEHEIGRNARCVQILYGRAAEIPLPPLKP